MGERPDPREMRMMRDCASISLGLLLSSSFSVMLSMMHMKDLMRPWLSASLPCHKAPM